MMGNNAIKNALVKYLGEEKHLENNNLTLGMEISKYEPHLELNTK